MVGEKGALNLPLRHPFGLPPPHLCFAKTGRIDFSSALYLALEAAGLQLAAQRIGGSAIARNCLQAINGADVGLAFDYAVREALECFVVAHQLLPTGFRSGV